jgi:hypothetical protein
VGNEKIGPLSWHRLPSASRPAFSVTKRDDGKGNLAVARADTYNGGLVSFVPFTGTRGSPWVGATLPG